VLWIRGNICCRALALRVPLRPFFAAPGSAAQSWLRDLTVVPPFRFRSKCRTPELDQHARRLIPANLPAGQLHTKLKAERSMALHRLKCAVTHVLHCCNSAFYALTTCTTNPKRRMGCTWRR
jgi:hypothetical protein